MRGPSSAGPALEEAKLNVRVKLLALWTSVMFCYIYADYFDLMAPGTLRSTLNGQGPIGPFTPATLLLASLMLAIPSPRAIARPTPSGVCRA
jgi:hypothetical protein